MCVFWGRFRARCLCLCSRVCVCVHFGLKGVCLQFDLFYLMQARWYSLKIYFFPQQIKKNVCKEREKKHNNKQKKNNKSYHIHVINNAMISIFSFQAWGTVKLWHICIRIANAVKRLMRVPTDKRISNPNTMLMHSISNRGSGQTCNCCVSWQPESRLPHWGKTPSCPCLSCRGDSLVLRALCCEATSTWLN